MASAVTSTIEPSGSIVPAVTTTVTSTRCSSGASCADRIARARREPRLRQLSRVPEGVQARCTGVCKGRKGSEVTNSCQPGRQRLECRTEPPEPSSAEVESSSNPPFCSIFLGSEASTLSVILILRVILSRRPIRMDRHLSADVVMRRLHSPFPREAR